MSEYTPTTDEVREGYAEHVDSRGGGPLLGSQFFDRWYEAEKPTLAVSRRGKTNDR